MDPLTDVLRVAAVRGSVAATLLAAEPWGLALPQVPGAAFHAITAGAVRLEVAGEPARRLLPGDAVLLPDGRPHRLLSDEEAPVEDFDHRRTEAALLAGTPLRVGAGTPVTRVLCAAYDRDPRALTDPFALLPPVVHLPAATSGPGLRSTVALLDVELTDGGPGLRVVLDHVVNVLLVQVLRAALTAGELVGPSWLRGLRDPVTASVLAAVHADPGRFWDVPALARTAGVSVATLQRRFAEHVGTSPSDYLAAWRMELAAARLRSSDEPVGAVAREVGYTSEYAFNRAFRRHHGQPPGRYRTAA